MTNREKFFEVFNKNIFWSSALNPQILALRSAHIEGIDCMEEWLNSEYVNPQDRKQGKNIDRYTLGQNAWIITSAEKEEEKAKIYADNTILCEIKDPADRVICLQVITEETKTAVIMDTEQARTIRKALKMQIKAIKEHKKDKNKSYYEMTKEAAERM